MLLDALAPDVVRERVVGGVVEQQHVALRSDDEAQQLAVVAARGEYIDDVHAGLDAGEAHHLGGLLGGIAFQIVVAAAGVRDGVVVDVGVARARRVPMRSAPARSARSRVIFLCTLRTWQALGRVASTIGTDCRDRTAFGARRIVGARMRRCASSPAYLRRTVAASRRHRSRNPSRARRRWREAPDPHPNPLPTGEGLALSQAGTILPRRAACTPRSAASAPAPAPARSG